MPFFDHNATHPLAPVARETWLRVQEENWHNPSGLTRASARAQLRLDQDRERLADYLGAKPERVVFTSGATEGVQAVLAHWARTLPADARVGISPTEHACVWQAAQLYLPGRYTTLRLDGHGALAAPEAQGDLTAGLAAVVVMAANNETGILNPWEAWAEWGRERGVSLLCDASQWVGKLSSSTLGTADWVVASAHKWGGPKGVGVLVRAASQAGFRIHAGGTQQRGARGGTEDVAGAAAAVAALVEIEQKKVFLESERCLWRDDFVRNLVARDPSFRVLGAGAERLWNTVAVLVPRGANTRWVTLLDKLGFQVSTGSACASGKEAPSHVLAAMGCPADDLGRVLRFSAGWETSRDDWNGLLECLLALRSEFPAGDAPCT